jgi:gamma-glutamylcyclotransferase (GGCT)/AIG2-like uncharacterized protein YtfP
MEGLPAASGLTRPYFGYGSNMHSATIAEWAPDARFVGAAHLPDFRLAFLRRSIRWKAGAADIVEAPGDVVWGALYELTEAEQRALDEKEYLGTGYRRRSVRVLCEGRTCDAITYEVIEKAPHHLEPKPEYVDLLVAGAIERGLPAEWVEVLRTTKGAP